ncbi:MAG TPA: hypothetical protein VF190_06015, partial [Rhodothermales bacterium]
GELSMRSIAIRLFLTCWLVYGFHFATNIVREVYPALSLGDSLSFDVSGYVGLHPDIFELPDGRAYINNNPGASILAAAPYAAARPVIDAVVERVNERRQASNDEPVTYDTQWPNRQRFFRAAYERGLDVKFGLAAGVMQFFLMAPLTALSAVVMFFLLNRLTGSVRASVWLSVLYAFATPVFYRTGFLNHNLLLGHLGFFAFLMIWRPWSADGPLRPLYLFVAGVLVGWTVVLDYSGLVVVLCVSGYVLAKWLSQPPTERRISSLAFYAAGVALSGFMLMLYQWSAFGHPIWPAQHYMPATDYSDEGLDGMGLPTLDLLWQTAFSIRYGLFTSAPILLLALYPPSWLEGRFRLLERRETWFVLLFTVALFLFCAANRYSYVQFNTGVRYAVPLVPFLFLIVSGVLLKMPRWAAVAVSAVGLYWSWCLSMIRDVELGLGIFDTVRDVTLGGPRLPWLTTLERMGYVSNSAIVWVVLAAMFAAVGLLWTLRVGRPSLQTAS